MRSGLEFSWEKSVSFDIVSSTVFIKEFFICKVDQLSVDILADERIKVRHGCSSNSVRTIDSSVNGILPSQIISSFDEIVAECFPEFSSHFFSILDFFL